MESLRNALSSESGYMFCCAIWTGLESELGGALWSGPIHDSWGITGGEAMDSHLWRDMLEKLVSESLRGVADGIFEG